MTATLTRRFSGAALRRLRLARGLTATELARRTDIPVDTLRDYERKRYVPPADRLFLLATALDVAMTDLFTEEDDES